VKVILSESALPLVNEASDFKETLWFDGLHPAFRILFGDFEIHPQTDEVGKKSKPVKRPNTGRLNIDQMRDALQRLATAYVIHIETEKDKKGFHWGRFGPIAHSLMESPLYVFHYLKKQEREDDRVIDDEKLARYIRYADTVFDPQPTGDLLMHYSKQLTTLYRKFYRVGLHRSASSYTLLRPLDIVFDALMDAKPDFFDSLEALMDVAIGTLKKRLDSSETKAYIVRTVEAEQAMEKFCQVLVYEVFDGIFKRNVAALRGRQLNLLRNACEYRYQQIARLEDSERKQLTTDPMDEDTSTDD
jgi:CRISPR-associated protein Csc3